VVCRFLWRPLLARLSLLKWKLLTLLKMWRLKFRIRKASLPINKGLSLLESSWKMGEPFQTTIFRRNLLFTWFFGSVVVCRFLWRLLQAKLSLWKLKLQIPLKMWRQKFRIRKVFPPINKGLSLLVSSWRMDVHFLITISRRNLLFI